MILSKMRLTLAATWTVFGLIACSPDNQPAEVTAEAGFIPGSEDEIRVLFACDDGQTVEMRFFPMQDLALMTRNGTTLELPQQISASGFIYSNGPNTVRGRGNELTVEIGRRAPIQCQALPDDSQ
jgi:membrane-bound inhibitor of C-type lysozyme